MAIVHFAHEVLTGIADTDLTLNFEPRTLNPEPRTLNPEP